MRSSTETTAPREEGCAMRCDDLTLRGALIHAARVTICGQAPRRHGLGGA